MNTGSAVVSPATARHGLDKRAHSKPSGPQSVTALNGAEAEARASRSMQSLPVMHSHHARSGKASNPVSNASGMAFHSLLDSQFWPIFLPALADYAVFGPMFRAVMFGALPLAAPPQAPSAKIAFASNRDGSAQIYLMNTDGSDQTRLTISAGNDEAPRWSPDNTRILFQSDRDNPFSCLAEIYVMNADGSNQTHLTNDAADDSAPVWSPDGTKIVFQSARNGLYYQVYLMNADGSGQTNLSNGTTNEGQPSWSPDGAKILFTSERDHPGTPGIYVMNADGSNQTRLTFSGSGVRDEQPAWSPDGMKLAFTSTRDSTVETWEETDDEGGILVKTRIRTNKEVYLMNNDGSNQVRLTNTLESDDSPAWSADGTKIVFRSDRERECCDPVAQVWQMNADGSNQADLSNNQVGDYSPAWQLAEGNALPSVSTTSPANGATFIAPASVSIAASAGDSDGTISKVDFYQGTTLLGTATSSPYSFTWNNVPVGTYSLTAKATDNSGGVTTSAPVSITVNPNQPSGDQFVGSLHQWALLRQPNSEEQPYWDDILRVAYARGQASMVMAVRELGKTVFESAEYADRTRDDRGYVYDLYKTYCMREPDAGGWDYWEDMVPSQGREAVRRAFDESAEFINVVATITPTGSASSAVSSLLSARVDPQNQPGSGLLGRDAEWTLPLLSLPGRSGLDLGLALSYSSMVWTRSGPYIYFDEDNGSPSPGFRLGFPTVQEQFFDAQVGQNAYVLITPGGSRTELRQVGSSSTYEAADSSYLQLIDYGSSLLVRSTDGTQLSYTKLHNEWRCNQIKDRNGNVITVNYNWLGQITTITDTLARVITFNYDVNDNLLSITQTWAGQPQPHEWATFGWSTTEIQPGFSGVSGVANGAEIPVLTQVGLADSSYYKFVYSPSTGQVSRITHYASDSNPATDNHALAYTAFDYLAPDDVTRLTARRVWAEYWNGANGVPAEVTTQYSDLGDGSHQVIAPDGTIYKEFYGPANIAWQRGLTVLSEVWSGGVRQKWTTTDWTQDNTGVNYQTNPRPTETNVYDVGNNRRRTKVSYVEFTLPSGTECNLPSDVKEYEGNATTVYRRRHTDYNLDAAYLNRGIIGLPGAVFVCDGAGEPTPCGNGSGAGLLAKVEYQYDANGEFLQSQGATVQHDETNYTAEFVNGRGNLTSIRRWNAEAPNDASQALESRLGYNTNGSVIFARDPLGHANRQASLSYADSFSADGVNLDAPRSFVTLAFSTTITDADGHGAYVRYHYDFGAKTRGQGPPPAGQSQGAVQTFEYDEAGRMERTTMTDNGAYTRYVYGPNYVQSFSTVNSVADDAYSIQIFNGLGQAVGIAGNHPGTDGWYKAQNIKYDLMGRAVKQSNPTEINDSWVPYGDDAAGWLYTQQTYDWNGRPLLTTNTDATTKEASYSGCGCAGGEVVTLTDEGTIDGEVAKRRQQKIYSDVFGRTSKTEVLNWEGGSVYATTVNTSNVRDQVTQVRQHEGSEGSGTYQDTTMAYDGFGRLKTKHTPEQDAGTSTTWDYNPDDTVQKVTDARGASATYGYNARHQVTGITYAAPSGITIPNPVSFVYDAAGNRTSMTDGAGTTTYQYDQLSAMTSETRSFSGLGGSYTLGYDYNVAGELKSVTDPFGGTVTYTYDQAGRLKIVTGPNPGNPQYPTYDYIREIKYRASGEYKHIAYGDNLNLDLEYNARLQTTKFKVAGMVEPQVGQGASYTVMAQSFFSHYADGRVKGVHLSEGGSAANSYDYDQKGRLQEGNHYLNYAQNYDYDAWDNLTSRTGSYHGTDHSSFSATYLNNRNTAWGYDQAGNMISDGQRQYSHDVANRTTFVSGLNTSQMSQIYDGDGQAVKVTKNGAVSYYVRSSVIGQIITELNALGSRKVRYVYANGRLLAELIPQVNLPDEIFWVHENPVTSERLVTAGCGIGVRQMSFDALGNAVENNNYANTCQSSEPDPSQELMETSWDAMYGDSSNTATGCYVDGFETSCSTAANIVNNGAGVPCPDNYCGPRSVVYQGQRTWAYFNAYGDGYSGYIPSSARYTGNGNFVPRGSGGPSSLRTNTINDTNFADLNGATDEAMLGFPQDTGQQAKYGNLEKCQRTYLAEQYPEGKPQPTDLAIGLALDGGLNDTGDSAMILALWAKESSFDPRPRNDHGPMQLTSWWSNYSNRNNFNLIVPGAYDSFGRPEGSPNRDRRFQGKISANVMTAGNIIRHSRTALGQSYYQIGYGYGPGPDKATRNDYATHASRLQSRYANFINCLKTGQ